MKAKYAVKILEKLKKMVTVCSYKSFVSLSFVLTSLIWAQTWIKTVQWLRGKKEPTKRNYIVWVEIWNIIFDKQCAFDTTGDVLFAKKLKLVTLLHVIHFTLFFFYFLFSLFFLCIFFGMWTNEWNFNESK